MAGVEIISTSTGNTFGIGPDGADLTATIRVRMDSKDDTGVAVIAYIRANGYEIGSEYEVGNDRVRGSSLFQMDPPEFVEGSQWLWDVTCYYSNSPERKKPNGEGTNRKTELRPKMSVGTIAREAIVDKAFYRGGVNGPGGSWRAVNVTGPANDQWQFADGDQAGDGPVGGPVSEGDGSFAKCVGLIQVENSYGNLSAFPVGHQLCPPIQNSANQAYNPPPTRQVTHGTVQIERNVPAAAVTGGSFPVDWINNVDLVLYSSTMTVPVFAYTMRLMRWRFTEEYDDGVEELYLRIVAELELNPRGWRTQVSDAGTHGVKRVGCDYTEAYAGGEFGGERIITKDDLDGECREDFPLSDKERGNSIGKQVYMDGNGKKLKEPFSVLDEWCGESIPAGTRLDPVISFWSVYDEINPLTLPFFNGVSRPWNN